MPNSITILKLTHANFKECTLELPYFKKNKENVANSVAHDKHQQKTVN